MKVFVTGAGGFIGGHMVRHLQARGHEVWALVRDPARARLPEGVHAVAGDLQQVGRWAPYLSEMTALVHLAARYRVGVVGAAERAEMAASNVAGTAAVLEAGWRAGVSRMLYVSTTAALGETHGAVRDESARHNGVFRSFYEQTKHVAHGIAQDLQRQGAPLCIAMPGGVFGPGDRSDLAQALQQFLAGKLPAQVACDSRFQLCHVDLVCDGLMRVLEQGQPGRNYLLTGELVSLAELLARAAALSGLREPSKIPRARLAWLARVGDSLRPLGVRLPLTQEALAVMDGSTYTYGSARAEAELGWPWQAARAQFWTQFDAYLRSLQSPTVGETPC